MSDKRPFRQGDVVLVSMPFISDSTQAKVRPAVIVQNDVGNRFSPNLIVVSISSQLPKRSYPTNLIVRQNTPEAQVAGLDRDSVVQAEVILTIPKTSIVKLLGRFDEVMMRVIDQCLKVSLGLS